VTPALVATDLDRTLLRSARAAGPADPDDPAEVVVLERRRGVVTASLTRRAASGLAALDRDAVWVPATTRSTPEYRRLDLPGALGVAPRWVVCAGGAVLLAGDRPDAAWAARVGDLLAGAAPLAEVAGVLDRHLAALPPHDAGRVRSADGALLVVRVRAPAGWVEELRAAVSGRGWRVVAHDEKVHLVPVALDKAAAVAEVRRRCGAVRLLAAGDSPLDAGLLLAADAGIQPADGRLRVSGWHADHVAVTASSGLRAGEEIVAWLRASLAGPLTRGASADAGG
jgi:hypothetical protein